MSQKFHQDPGNAYFKAELKVSKCYMDPLKSIEIRREKHSKTSKIGEEPMFSAVFPPSVRFSRCFPRSSGILPSPSVVGIRSAFRKVGRFRSAPGLRPSASLHRPTSRKAPLLPTTPGLGKIPPEPAKQLENRTPVGKTAENLLISKFDSLNTAGITEIRFDSAHQVKIK